MSFEYLGSEDGIVHVVTRPNDMRLELTDGTPLPIPGTSEFYQGITKKAARDVGSTALQPDMTGETTDARSAA